MTILVDIVNVNAAREIVESIAVTVSDTKLRETFRKYNRTIIERRVHIDRIGK